MMFQKDPQTERTKEKITVEVIIKVAAETTMVVIVATITQTSIAP